MKVGKIQKYRRRDKQKQRNNQLCFCRRGYIRFISQCDIQGYIILICVFRDIGNRDLKFGCFFIVREIIFLSVFVLFLGRLFQCFCINFVQLFWSFRGKNEQKCYRVRRQLMVSYLVRVINDLEVDFIDKRFKLLQICKNEDRKRYRYTDNYV